MWRRRARVFDWAEGIGEYSVWCVANARAAALRLPATQAWDEAWRAARSLTIGVDAEDLEWRIRAGVVCLHILRNARLAGWDAGVLGAKH